ncbi:hypothetical protein NMG60_11020962 [Bertholletia excelsa]
MDDTCAVCAETLEWVAYGQCGHREVCSTCITRLRFICDDCRCCICKSESNIIFVTKALGDYTRMINDFSNFPVNPTEGQVGSYWYHEGTRAFFDDLDHYKMIVEMCKLSCIVCNKKDEQGRGGSKKGRKFRNIEQLKSHLFHDHKLFMCSLCLQGRKTFICEQKLYSRAQLNQHIKTGDAEVDGNESERGGFMGHPTCEFCRNPFYGDNELYVHMSTEHYTCHLCQRQHPGVYNYYRNYDDLEIHFRQEHFLCEDEGCLAKKFIVFKTESEMKRHNIVEHGRRMSRSKRNAALQIPLNFHYRSSMEQDQTGRQASSCPDYSDSQIPLAIQASVEAAHNDTTHATSSRAQANSHRRQIAGFDTSLGFFEPLSSTDFEPSSRGSQADRQNSINMPLGESSFPPLPTAARSSHHNTKNDSRGSGRNTMAANLLCQNKVTVLNVSRAQPAASRQPPLVIDGFSRLRPMSNSGSMSSHGPACSTSRLESVDGAVPSNFLSTTQSRVHRPTADRLSASPSSSSTKTRSINMASPSASTSNPAENGFLDPNTSNFPPISATNSKKFTKTSLPFSKFDDVYTSNKSLGERVCADLKFDKDKYAAFREISSEYYHGLIEPGEYLGYIYQFGLLHLVHELAKICPDARKQKELVEVYGSGSLGRNGTVENSTVNNCHQLKHRSSRKGKEKSVKNGISSSNGALADNIIECVRELQLNSKPSEVAEVLSKDGYCTAKDADDSKRRVETKGGGKARRKTSKFHRVRLGESSKAAVLELKNSSTGPDIAEAQSDRNAEVPERLPVQGAWKNGGGRKLMANW